MDGLAEVLRGWSGRGQLYEALATVEDDLTEVRWQRRDIERRARRILLPSSNQTLSAGPPPPPTGSTPCPGEPTPAAYHGRSAPGNGWIETRSLGWPAEQFIVKDRSRIADQTMSRTLRWVLDQLLCPPRRRPRRAFAP